MSGKLLTGSRKSKQEHLQWRGRSCGEVSENLGCYL